MELLVNNKALAAGAGVQGGWERTVVAGTSALSCSTEIHFIKSGKGVVELRFVGIKRARGERAKFMLRTGQRRENGRASGGNGNGFIEPGMVH